MIELRSFAYGFLACGVLAIALGREAINRAYSSGYSDAATDIIVRDFAVDGSYIQSPEFLDSLGQMPKTPPSFR